MKQRRKDPRKRITGITKSDEEQRQERRTCKGGTRRREKVKDKSNQDLHISGCTSRIQSDGGDVLKLLKHEIITFSLKIFKRKKTQRYPKKGPYFFHFSVLNNKLL